MTKKFYTFVKKGPYMTSKENLELYKNRTNDLNSI